MADWAHEMALAATPHSVAAARRFVSGHLSSHRLPHLIEDVRLVTSELATNAVAHAHSAFVITLATADGSVVVTVRDMSALPLVPATPELFDVRGRGLLLVAALSQAWGTSSDERGGKSVWVSFSCDPAVLDPAEPAGRA